MHPFGRGGPPGPPGPPGPYGGGFRGGPGPYGPPPPHMAPPGFLGHAPPHMGPPGMHSAPRGPHAPPHGGPTEQAPPAQKELPKLTTFVGRIASGVPDDLLKKILRECGEIVSWQRARNPDTNELKAFGFCQFASVEGVERAVRVLDGLEVAGRALLVKPDDMTKKVIASLEDFADGKDKLSDSEAKEDGSAKEKIEQIIKETDLSNAGDNAAKEADALLSKMDGAPRSARSSRKEERIRRKLARAEAAPDLSDVIRGADGKISQGSIDKAALSKEILKFREKQQKAMREKPREQPRPTGSGSRDGLSSADLPDDASREAIVREWREEMEKQQRRVEEQRHADAKARYREKLRRFEGREEELLERLHRAQSKLRKRRRAVAAEMEKRPALIKEDEEDTQESDFARFVAPSRRREREHEADDDERDRRRAREEDKAKQSESTPTKDLQSENATDTPKDAVLSKDELYGREVQWDLFTSRNLLETAIMPFVRKQVVAYLGEEEETLIGFISDLLKKRTSPVELEKQMAMILDDEAAKFVEALWRELHRVLETAE